MRARTSLYFLGSVLLMAAVGAMAAFRILLVRPIFDNVLSPDSPTKDVLVFPVAHLSRPLNLHFLVPSHFHNAWTVVAYALVMSAVLKSCCDYLGTYLVNYAGFGMITDLRNDLYEAVLRRSVAFFQKHTTGSLLSTLINDIEKVQFAMSSVLGEFLQQVVHAAVYVGGGDPVRRQDGVGAAAVCAGGDLVGAAHRKPGAADDAQGQDKLAEIQNILHETITGNRIVKAFGMELWEMDRFRRAARRLFRANLRQRQCAGDQLAVDGCLRRRCDCAAAVDRPRADSASLR